MKKIKWMIGVSLVVASFMVFVACSKAYQAGLAEAARSGDIAKAEKYLSQGAGINKEWFGTTALMVAAENGKLEMVKFLIGKGSNINLKSKFDKTALDYAKQGNHADVAAYLEGLPQSK